MSSKVLKFATKSCPIQLILALHVTILNTTKFSTVLLANPNAKCAKIWTFHFKMFPEGNVTPLIALSMSLTQIATLTAG